MTRKEMVAWLKQRYQEQAEKFPLMWKDIDLETYIKANLSHMIKSDYWRSRGNHYHGS